jgi:peptidylprolyl isomerase
VKTIETGHFVKVCYTAKLEDGEVVDHTDKCNPIEIEVGAGNLIKGFEDALLGMELNEKKTFTLPPEEAYGMRDEELEQTFPRSELPADFQPGIGEVVVLENQEGGQTLATVKHSEAESLVVDLNHPLAGKTLTFEIEVAEINDQPSPAHSTCGSGCCCS